MLDIMNAKGEKPRNAAYVDLLKITGKVLGYARNTVKIIKSRVVAPSCIALLADIEHYAQLAEKVIDQTHRRVVLGQKVAAATVLLLIGSSSLSLRRSDFNLAVIKKPIFIIFCLYFIIKMRFFKNVSGFNFT